MLHQSRMAHSFSPKQHTKNHNRWRRTMNAMVAMVFATAACIDSTMAADIYDDKYSNHMLNRRTGVSLADQGERIKTFEKGSNENVMHTTRNRLKTSLDNTYLRNLSALNDPSVAPTIRIPLEPPFKTKPTSKPVENIPKSLQRNMTTEPTSSAKPSQNPTVRSSTLPSNKRSAQPSVTSSVTPTLYPTSIPTHIPSASPQSSPSHVPSTQPSPTPSTTPSRARSQKPSSTPSGTPSHAPSTKPSMTLSSTPSLFPTSRPSDIPSHLPSTLPSVQPSPTPSLSPSLSPSLMPSDIPTHAPSALPQSSPSHVPSMEPSSTPSSMPSDVPTHIPSYEPSIQPSIGPSTVPSNLPSLFPSEQPTGTPSGAPSSIPSGAPSSIPSGTPSSTPSNKPSVWPSNVPSKRPSAQPSGLPSDKPTISYKPSAGPSSTPSSKPSLQPSATPTKFPSTTPTLSPSSQPSYSPSLSLQDFDFQPKISLEFCNILSESAKEIFANVTRDTIKENIRSKYSTTQVFLEVRVNELKMVLATFGDFNTSVAGDGMDAQQPGRLLRQKMSLDQFSIGYPRESGLERRVQALPDLLIEFNLEIDIRSPANLTPRDMLNSVLETYDTIDEQNGFIMALQTYDGNDNSFEAVDRVDIVIDGNRVKNKQNLMALPEGKGVEFYGPIIGGSVVALLIGVILWRRKADVVSIREVDENETPMSFQNTAAFNESIRTPDFRLASEIHVDAEEQDISTLGDPHPAPNHYGVSGAVIGNDSQSHPAFGGFDFTRAYGGAAGGGLVPNDAGIQSALDPQISPNVDAASSTDQSSIDQENISLFTDDESFERMYGGGEADDERIELVAPPGKLGVVIDTPLSGIPMVHAIKDTSVLSGQVLIGDKLVSVDGTDTTQMSAIRVSKLISSKAQNQRILVFHRTPNET